MGEKGRGFWVFSLFSNFLLSLISTTICLYSFSMIFTESGRICYGVRRNNASMYYFSSNCVLLQYIGFLYF